MSLIETNTVTVVKKQFLYKLKSNNGTYISLIAAQLIALFFSFNGSIHGGGHFSNYLHIKYKIYSADMIIGFTMLWAVITAITITTKPYRDFDFMFTANRLTSNLSNIAFVLLYSLVGSLSATLLGVFLKVIHYFTATETIMWENFKTPPEELLLGFYVTALYLLFISAAGYLFGMLIQTFKPFVIIIPMILFGVLRVSGGDIYDFFIKENSLLVFSAKVLLTAIVLFISSIVLTNKLEVRK